MSMYSPDSYDLGVGSYDDPAQPQASVDAPSASVSNTLSSAASGLKTTHWIAFIFFAALAIYSGAAYWFFRRINQAI